MESKISAKLGEINHTMKSRNIELVQSEHQFKTFFEELAKPACIFNLHTMRFIQVNRELSDLLGYSKKELLNANLSDLIVKEDLDPSIETAYENSRGNHLASHTNRYITKKNTIVTVNWIFSRPDELGNSFCIAEEVPILEKLIK